MQRMLRGTDAKRKEEKINEQQEKEEGATSRESQLRDLLAYGISYKNVPLS